MHVNEACCRLVGHPVGGQSDFTGKRATGHRGETFSCANEKGGSPTEPTYDDNHCGVEGFPGAEILHAVEDHQIDLIILGTR